MLHTLYLIFNEGYTSTSGPDPYRAKLSSEAIRLARMVYRLLPDDGEVAGLLALMLLTDARRPARAGPTGELIPLADQERSLWNREFITEGIALITDSMSRPPVGPYQLQAAIAAVHDEAERSADTDWPQIAALYQLLLGISDNPMVRLNFAGRWLGPIIAGGIGLLFSVIGGVLFWAGRTGRFTARGSSSSGPERGASALHHPDFPPARPGTNGYDVGAVHILLARIEQAYGELAVGRPPQRTPAELAQTQLAQACPGRPGYDQLTVDQYLRTVHADLGRARTAH